MNTEASPAPGDGNGIETPSTTAHWIEEAIPEDAVCEVGGESVPLREHPGLREFKSPADMARSLLHARSLVGRKTIGLTPLGEDASDSERQEFEAELRRVQGVPDSPDGYEVPVPDGMEADTPLIDWYRDTAHSLGLSPQQVSGLAEKYNELVSQYAEGQSQAAEMQRHETQQSLGRLWGERAGENVAIARRGFVRAALAAGVGEDEARGFLDQYGDDAVMVRIFHSVGMAFREDSLAEGDAGPRRSRPAMSTERFFAEEVFGA